MNVTGVIPVAVTEKNETGHWEEKMEEEEETLLSYSLGRDPEDRDRVKPAL